MTLIFNIFDKYIGYTWEVFDILIIFEGKKGRKKAQILGPNFQTDTGHFRPTL